MTIPWTVVPNYNYEAACQGMSPEAIRMELEIDWTASRGLKVYPEFSRDKHVALDKIEADVERPFYIGWDWATCPSAVITQTNAYGQWLILDAVTTGEDESREVYEFGMRVADFLTQNYALPNGIGLEDLRMIHVGDPAGQARLPRTGERPQDTRSYFEIIRRGLDVFVGEDMHGRPIIERKKGLGWKIIAGQVGIPIRLESVRARLTTSLKDGVPALVVSPQVTSVIDAFSGGYHYHAYNDGSYSRDPEKNWEADVMDALGYIATRLYPTSKVRKTEEEDEDYDRGPRVTSVAGRRY